MRSRYIIGALLLSLTVVICAAFSFTGDGDFDLAKQEILLRDIGHQVLLHSGDSTSRVLPVEKITANEYHIRFENDFTFQSDSLVKIISRSLDKSSLSHNYIVNVLDCSGKNVVYGFAIQENKKNNIIACSGRKQLKTCYVIDIKFQNDTLLNPKNGYLIGGIPLLAFIGLFISRSVKKLNGKIEGATVVNGTIIIGQLTFDTQNRQLINDDATIELTAKENKLLLILSSSLNTIVPRSRLQKEIWEDEGVIVGRSLDMFISKLRKKLEIEPSVKLTNVHGKGYRLDTV